MRAVRRVIAPCYFRLRLSRAVIHRTAHLRLRVCVRACSTVTIGTGESSSVVERLQRARSAGKLLPDVSQDSAAAALQRLTERVVTFAHARTCAQAALRLLARVAPDDAAVKQLLASEHGVAAPCSVTVVGSVPRGAYLRGPVGTGKSMLLDMLTAAAKDAHVAPPSAQDVLTAARKLLESVQPHAAGTRAPLSDVHVRVLAADDGRATRVPVRRVHFHEFMLQMHARIHEFKRQQLRDGGRSGKVDLRPERDAIRCVAADVAREAWLLCFDEFQVTDVADAMILSRFFQTLWAHGCVVVATSNVAPRDLYAGGLNREYFLPFINMLTAMCKEIVVDAGRDHRMAHAETRRAAGQRFVTPVGAHSRDALARILVSQGRASDVALTTAALHAVGEPEHYADPAHITDERTLALAWERSMRVRTLRGSSTALLSFEDACGGRGPTGVPEFLALASAFPAFVLLRVPRLSVTRMDAARRLVTLLDVLYDAGRELYMESDVEPQHILSAFTGLTDPTDFTGSDPSSVCAPMSQAAATARSAALEDLATASRRAVSRLRQLLG